MQIIALTSRKGGVGKSMAARSLAVAALIDGRRAAIVDADPQGSIVAWSQRREEQAPSVIAGNTAKLAELERAGADIVFIDTPPSVHPVIGMAIEAADLTLILTGPYPEDLAAIGSSVQMVRNIGIKSGIVLNRTPTRSAALSLARSALTAFDLPICPTAIAQRVAHPYASASGQTAQEWEPDGAAAAEIQAVWKWAKEILNA
jgi:chromosome partitioning protein